MLIVDTGPLVATADDADRDHERCRTLLEAHPGPLLTSLLIVAEAGWLIRRQLDMSAETALYTSIAAGEIIVEALTTTDWARVAQLLGTYGDIGLDAADASIIALAERLGLMIIATLDYPDFRVVRPAHCDAFELVP